MFHVQWCAVKLLQPDRSFIVIAGVGTASAVSQRAMPQLPSHILIGMQSRRMTSSRHWLGPSLDSAPECSRICSRRLITLSLPLTQQVHRGSANC